MEKYYPKLKDFFVKKIGIPEKPIAEDYAKILIEISEKESVEKPNQERILKIYKELNKFLEPENSKDSSITEEVWWEDFVTKGIFWTNKSNFWRNNNDVFVNDDDEVYELFKNKDEVAFLEVPQSENPEYASFVKETGLKHLSKSIKTKIETSVDCDFDEKLTKKIDELLIYIVRYLYHEENAIYKKAKKDERLSNLVNLRCYGVLDLNVEYNLHTESVVKDDTLFLDSNKLYVKIDDLEDYEQVSIVLSKMFGSPKGLSDFIENLFIKPSNEKRESSLKTKRIRDLPKEELDWFETHQAQSKVLEIDKNVEVEDVEKRIKSSEDEEIQKKNPNSRRSKQVTDSKEKTSLENKDSSQNSDWKPEANPSEIDIDLSEPIVPDVKPSTISDDNVRKNPSTLENQYRQDSKSENLSQQSKKNIGRSGEEFTIAYLHKYFTNKYAGIEIEETDTGFNGQLNKKTIVEVIWLNKNGETGIGRDIDYIENGEIHYLEVKATISSDKKYFHISKAEWQLAKKTQENYHIFRVYNAGTKNATHDEYRNPYKLWEENRISFRSISLEI